LAKKQPLRIHEVTTIASAGLGTIRTVRVPEGQLWYVQRVAFEGSSATSGGNTRARAYIGGHGPCFYIFEQDAPTAAALYWEDDPLWLWPGEWIAMEWDAAQASAVLNLYVYGFLVSIEE